MYGLDRDHVEGLEVLDVVFGRAVLWAAIIHSVFSAMCLCGAQKVFQLHAVVMMFMCWRLKCGSYLVNSSARVTGSI